MVFLKWLGIVIASIVALFILELLFVALYPDVRVAPQPLERIKRPQATTEINATLSRREVSFTVKGTPVSAWLFLPTGASSPVPCIIMAHGMGGTKSMGLEGYAARFQEAGLAVLAFDFRCLGTSGGEPRQLVWIPYQLEDYAAAVVYARSLKEVDPERIALWGTSLSGGHVISIAAEDKRIACVSAQVPLLDGAEAAEENFNQSDFWQGLRIVGHAQRDLVRSWLGLSPYKIPIFGKPGTVALMADEGAWEALNALAPDDYVNEACARIGIRMDKYRPITAIDKVRCPVLIQVCDKDITVPKAVLDKATDSLGPLAEVIRYPGGHFDIYMGNTMEKAADDQVNFFQRHLLSNH
jgi:fermentation-respiration switch protein FrsA (DUF1100 family)